MITRSYSPDEHAYWYGEIDQMKDYYESDTNYIGLSMEDLIASKLVHAFCLGRSMEQEVNALKVAEDLERSLRSINTEY